MKRILLFVSFLLATILLSACVTTSDSTLTKKADPVAAVERYVQLGLEYIKRGDLFRARKHITRALEIDENDAAANAAMGLISHQDGEYSTAEASFRKAIDSDPHYTSARSYYGAFLFSNQRYKEALTQFEFAAKDPANSGRTQVFTNIALCNIQLERFDDAIKAYDKALRLDRLNEPALIGITEVLLQKKNFERAQHYYNRLVRMIRQQGRQHTAQTIWLGIRIASFYNSVEQEGSLVMLLENLYPDSEEYRQYLNYKQLRNSDD